MHYPFNKFPLHEVKRLDYAIAEVKKVIETWDDEKKIAYENMPPMVREEIESKIRAYYYEAWDRLNPESYELAEKLYNAYHTPYMNGAWSGKSDVITVTEDYRGNLGVVMLHSVDEVMEFNFTIDGVNAHFYMSKKVFHAVMKYISELAVYPLNVKHRSTSYITKFGDVTNLALHVMIEVDLGKVIFSYTRQQPNFSQGRISFLMSFGELQKIQRKLKVK